MPISVRASGSEILAALDARQFQRLDAELNGLQKQYELGRIDEISLRDAFSSFYHLTPQQIATMQDWVKSSPNSYAAHLGWGIFLRRAALDVQSGQRIAELSSERLDTRSRLLEAAKPELQRAKLLTAKPMLAIFHLMGVSLFQGDHSASRALVDEANKIDPKNRLVRDRYMVTLTPRWGGSYPAMRSFIAASRTEGVDPDGIRHLEAIMYDDIGHSAMEAGDRTEAYKYFRMALDLGARIGGSFREDYLMTSNAYVCGRDRDAEYCK
ncbi:DUF4034 domain-containing protein [Ralstonia pickettii]|uniref:DUF4034 domain-containing protein n=1 Tax=Ralstonia pickettii TaxID=329 RepID=UPI0015BEAF01|nr:DUF4034 domain-containing protein [Ralstonia pickettii]NWK42931.1 DUF4034 domain-containing protein [Ralstonia pickettii]